mmetsp:Transcript_42459/g.72238  ORF Transcript_42459/g.72238 Transcript_42459/m.72238 type:complete len:103 (+) Transcript_42459:88-396(+)
MLGDEYCLVALDVCFFVQSLTAQQQLHWRQQILRERADRLALAVRTQKFSLEETCPLGDVSTQSEAEATQIHLIGIFWVCLRGQDRAQRGLVLGHIRPLLVP